MKSARKEDKFSNLTDLFQTLADEKNRQRTKSTINVIRKEAGNESKREDKKSEKDKKNKNKYFRCDRLSQSKEKCFAINSECIECHKTDH
jgi:hypothetical protein